MLRDLKYRARDVARHFGYDVGILRPDSDIGHFLTVLCEDRGIACVIDVGAHRGGFGQNLLRSGYTGKIVSFEPVLSFFTALTQVAAKTSPSVADAQNGPRRSGRGAFYSRRRWGRPAIVFPRTERTGPLAL